MPVRGEGCAIEDIDGNRFLDFAAGIAVNSTGRGHPQVIEAIPPAGRTAGALQRLGLLPAHLPRDVRGASPDGAHLRSEARLPGQQWHGGGGGQAPVAPTELIVARLDSTASFPGHAIPPCAFGVAVNVAVKRPAGGGWGGLQERF